MRNKFRVKRLAREETSDVLKVTRPRLPGLTAISLPPVGFVALVTKYRFG